MSFAIRQEGVEVPPAHDVGATTLLSLSLSLSRGVGVLSTLDHNSRCFVVVGHPKQGDRRPGNTKPQLAPIQRFTYTPHRYENGDLAQAQHAGLHGYQSQAQQCGGCVCLHR